MGSSVNVLGLIAGLVLGGIPLVAASWVWVNRQQFGAGGMGLAAAGTVVLVVTIAAYGAWPSLTASTHSGSQETSTVAQTDGLDQANAQIAELQAALEDAKQANQSMLATLNEINAERGSAVHSAPAPTVGSLTLPPNVSSPAPASADTSAPSGPPPGMPDPRGAFVAVPQAGVQPGTQPGTPMPNLPPSVVTPPSSATAATPSGSPDALDAFIAPGQQTTAGQFEPDEMPPAAPAGMPDPRSAFIAPGQ